MKLNHKDIAIQQYISEKIETDIVIYQQERKTVLVINNTAAAILDAITTAMNEKRDITTEEISQTLCKLYALGEEQFEEVCRDVNSTIDVLFDASLLTCVKND